MTQPESYSVSVLSMLEAESIHILREVAAECERPVMMYSVGKDSSTMLRLAQKAFHPARIPFPLLHVDTSYKFPEMYEFRDRMCRDIGVGCGCIATGSARKRRKPLGPGDRECCGLLKTQGLLRALRDGEYDAVIGGARREEGAPRQGAHYSFATRMANGIEEPTPRALEPVQRPGEPG
jgi:sulfate adenylyltransferase subunit 2